MDIIRSEWKYKSNTVKTRQLDERLSAIMTLDNHSQSSGSYLVHSLYFDDYCDTCLHQNLSGDSLRYKYRIRYYSKSSDILRLEKKKKINSFCHKTSCLITLSEYDMLVKGYVENLFWETNKELLKEFCIDTMKRYFTPKIIISYNRKAYVEPISNIRITFDSNVTASSDVSSFLLNNFPGIPLIEDDEKIMEVKFDSVLPSHIQGVLETEQLNQQSFSKYCIGRIATKY